MLSNQRLRSYRFHPQSDLQWLLPFVLDTPTPTLPFMFESASHATCRRPRLAIFVTATIRQCQNITFGRMNSR